MLTESEAKTKWCPHARVARVTDSGAGVAGNRVSDQNTLFCGDSNPTSARWLASACMAWRWAMEVHENDDPRLPDTVKPSTTRGFCGLAGQP